MRLAERRAAGAALVAGLTAAAFAAFASGGVPGGASAAQPAPGPTPTVPGRVEGARFVYLRDCAWCHGDRGEGSFYGPALRGVGAASVDFMLATGRMPIADPVEYPEAQIARAPPAYGPELIGELVEYVDSFGPPGPEIPTVDVGSASLSRGEDLYQDNCAACHSTTGTGGALTSGLVAPELEGLTATQIAEAIRIGGSGLRTGNMPQFGPEALSDEELAAVVRYVLYLQDPNDRGGAPLERLGPVAEGFVALAGGLLLLLVIVRWIGRPAPTPDEEGHG
ncbi:MAG TPA: c-type cytochrome [Actinomycetota bacterium]|nr:c-type cytochrome [Actinomycetota bacterium]